METCKVSESRQLALLAMEDEPEDEYYPELAMLTKVEKDLLKIPTDPQVRSQMVHIDRMRMGTDVCLSDGWTPLHDTMEPIVRALRKVYFPKTSFSSVRVLRGTDGHP